MNVYTLSDFEKILKQQGYKFISLYDSSGRQIVPFNNVHKSSMERLTEIKTRLKTPAQPDGFYIIRAKNNIRKTEPTDDYTIKKGNPKAEDAPKPEVLSEPAPATETASASESVLTYESALEMNTRINQLELENKQLKKERDEYKAELDEWEAAAEEAEAEGPDELKQLGDNAKSWIGQLAETLVPALDQYFEQNDRKLKMQELSMAVQMGQVPGIPQQAMQQPVQQMAEQPQQYTPEQQEELMQQMAHLAETDPDAYNQMIAQMMEEGE